MASTFWVELYFRSLNPNNVFKQLTNYLLQYRRVSIPSVGTIHLIQQPVQLDVANKIISPPTFKTEIRSDESVPEHQLAFLSAALQEEKVQILDRLSDLGKRIQNKLQGNGFEWKGIGWIGGGGDSIAVTPSVLQPVRAERVLRPDAEHNVLVGDQHMTSTQMSVLKEEVEVVADKERSIWMIVGWVLLGLAILYIIFLLYQGKFRVDSTGSKQSPTSYIVSPTNQII
ncbi:MAG TPA: hypothetical protein VGN63_18010 [Flavisolibacter sp.]|jgi:hypothetical protein|nr:hypothetical protein [Flavisolibacter sp.]